MWANLNYIRFKTFAGRLYELLKSPSPFWSRNLSHKQKSRLATMQRMTLLRVQNSVSWVGAGLDRRNSSRPSADRRQLPVQCEARRLSRSTSVPPKENRGGSKKLEKDPVERVDVEWFDTPKDATFQKYFGSSLEATWVLPNYWISQIFTGYWRFRSFHSLPSAKKTTTMKMRWLILQRRQCTEEKSKLCG